jgi:hypothetical protein
MCFMSQSAALCCVEMFPNSFKLGLHPFKSVEHVGKHKTQCMSLKVLYRLVYL